MVDLWKYYGKPCNITLHNGEKLFGKVCRGSKTSEWHLYNCQVGGKYRLGEEIPLNSSDIEKISVSLLWSW